MDKNSGDSEDDRGYRGETGNFLQLIQYHEFFAIFDTLAYSPSLVLPLNYREGNKGGKVNGKLEYGKEKNTWYWVYLPDRQR